MDADPAVLAARLLMGAGIALVAPGMAFLFYAAYLAMIRASAWHWYDRPVLLGPVGLALVVTGLLLIEGQVS